MLTPVDALLEGGGIKPVVTNWGPHSPETLARITANEIAQYGEDIGDGVRHQIDGLRDALAAVLIKHHALLQSDLRLQKPDEKASRIALAMDDILAVTAVSRWKDHFNRPDVQAIVRHLLVRNFKMSSGIEADWDMKTGGS